MICVHTKSSNLYDKVVGIFIDDMIQVVCMAYNGLLIYVMLLSTLSPIRYSL